MASEALEEARSGDGAPVEQKEEEAGEVDEAEKEKQGEEQDKRDDFGDSEKKNPAEDEGMEETKGGGGGGKKAKGSGKKSSAEGKEAVTPIQRPSRERKTVERYSTPTPGRSSGSKIVSIEKGRGAQLKDIPNVAFKLSKRKADDNLQMLHTILFGKKTTAQKCKRNIGQFSGYVWVESEQEKQRARIKDKLDKCFKEKLFDFCDILNIQINKANMRKEELSAKLLEFLESPHATTDVLLAEKEQKSKERKKKASMGKRSRSADTSEETSSKKLKRKRQSGENIRTPEVAEEDDDKVEPSDTKDSSHEHNDNDATSKEESKKDSESEDEESEPEEPRPSHKSLSKKNVKDTIMKEKTTPAQKGIRAKSVNSPEKATQKASGSSSKKGPVDVDGGSSSPKSKGSAAKKQQVERGSQKDSISSGKEKASGKRGSSKPPAKASTGHEGKGKRGKKTKVEPSREEMRAVVADILKEVDFNTATLSDILRQLGTHFGVDLMHRKGEVKEIITDVINNMSDEEEEESEENSEAEDGADEVEDKDNNA